MKKLLLALFVLCLTVGVVILHSASDPAGFGNVAIAAGTTTTGTTLVPVATTEAPSTTIPPTTTTTVDPAAIDAFLGAWQESETTTTTAPPPTTARPRPTNPPAPVAEQGSGRCGGDLPPCYVMMRESGGNIRAKNPSSSASGKWQFLDSTWQGYGGYSRAMDAPESVQDARARAVWAGGRGCSAWSAC